MKSGFDILNNVQTTQLPFGYENHTSIFSLFETILQVCYEFVVVVIVVVVVVVVVIVVVVLFILFAYFYFCFLFLFLF